MSTAAFPLDDPVEYWVLQVQQGFSIETVPEEFRAQVERRLNRVRESGVPVVARAAPQPVEKSEPWWHGTLGTVLAIVLPPLLVALLLWWLSRRAGGGAGGGFVEGFGKLKAG
jgi:hypothetical protein